MISATEATDSACRSANAICTFREVRLSHPKKPPFLVVPRFENLSSRMDPEMGRTAIATRLRVRRC